MSATDAQSASPTLQLRKASEYVSSKPASIGRPQMFASFSYGEDRELLLDHDRKDRSLRWYKQPVLELDLRYGFERCTWRPDELDEGLDGLLDCLLHSLQATKTSQAMAELLRKTSVITWRGIGTKLLTCIYEESEGWELNAMMMDDCLYLEENKKVKPRLEGQQLLQTYFGYSFESYCTSEHPYPPPATTADKSWGGDVNTNTQWAALVKTSLGGIPMILGGEVDCVQEGAGVESGLDAAAFIELKTNKVIEGQREETRFERYKLLKHYVQSVLLGVPSIVIGFRQNNGVLAGIQSFETRDIPSMVMGKPHAWHASSCLNSGRDILTFLLQTISSHPDIRAYPAVPVFRIAFEPASSGRPAANITIRQLNPDEIVQMQERKASREPRIGFLPERWVQSVQSRRSGEYD